MRRKALLSVMLSVVMILGSASPAFAAGQMPSSELTADMGASVPESQDEVEAEQPGQGDNNENSDQESGDVLEPAEDVEDETGSESEGADSKEEDSDEDNKDSTEEDMTNESKTDSVLDEEEKPETLVGAEGQRVSVGTNVTAGFDSDTGTVTFYSQGGTLSNYWVNTLGINRNDVRAIVISEDSSVMYLPNYSDQLFSSFTGLQSIDLSKVDTSNVKNMSGMFRHCSNLQTLDVSTFNTSNVTDMREMFYGCRNLQVLDVSGFDTSNVTNMYMMFNNCRSLQTLDVSGFDTSNVTEMHWMFSDCQNLQTLDVSGFDTSNVTEMSYMFDSCSSLQTLDVSGFDTSNVTNMSRMFFGCQNLQTLDVSGFNTSNVTAMSNMFYGCQNLQVLDVSGFDTSNVTYMDYLFYGCSSLQTLDVSGFDTSNVKNMNSMFSGCSNLHVLDLSGFDTSSLIHADSVLSGCVFDILLTPVNLNLTVALPGTYVDASGTQYNILPQGLSESIQLTKIKTITDATVIGITNKTYTGTAQTQNPTVKLGDKTLSSGTDYTLSYSNNTNVGTATVTITGKGNYTGTISKTFTISAASIVNASVSGISNQTYTGTAQTQNPTVKLGDKTLTSGTDYTLSYSNNTYVGTATVTIVGKGNYTGTVSRIFTINAVSIANATVSGISNKNYNGIAQTQNPTVKLGDRTLTAGTDYTLSYENNRNAGTATVTIAGQGNYTGTISKPFTINKAAPKLTFASTSITKTTQDAAFTNALTKTTDGNVTFKSSNTSVATVNSTSGKVTIKGAGTTTITVTAAAGTNYKAGSAQYTLNVTEALKIVSISDDFYGKTGTQASFHVETEGGGTITYQWQYRTAGMTSWKSPAQASAKTADYAFNLKPSYDNIEVRCIVSDESGKEIISETRKANVFALTSQPADLTASEGQTVDFKVTAIGRGVTYQWYYMRPNSVWKKTTVAGSKTAVLPIKAGTKNDGTSYRCVITDEEGNQITSAAGILTLGYSLKITGLSEDAYGKTGENVTFHIDVKGNGVTYQWQYKLAGESEWRTPGLAAAKTSDYVFRLRPSYDDIEVRCIVSDESGNEIVSETRKANVFALTSQPADLTASEGQTVDFKVTAIGRGVTYQWYYMRPNSVWNKTTVSGSKTAVLPITASAKNDGTSYRCVITDEEGNQITSAAGILTLDNSLRITGISEDAYGKTGESVTFHVDAKGNGVTYQWQYKLAGESKWRTPGQAAAKTADYVFTLRPSYDNIEVRCIVKDKAGNTCTSDVRKANVFAITKQPEFVFAELGEKVTFTVEGIGKDLTYQWYYRRLEGGWNKVTAAGYNTASLTVTAQVRNNASQYRCYVYDGLGNLIRSQAAMLIEEEEDYEG